MLPYYGEPTMVDWPFRERFSVISRQVVVLLVGAILSAGCGSLSANETSGWCEQVMRGVGILKVVRDEGGQVTDVEPEVAMEFGAVLEELTKLGWPTELSDELRVFEKGPQHPGSAEGREYDRAVETYEEFVTSECELSPEEAELFVGN